jgi:uncharacterized membrane protein
MPLSPPIENLNMRSSGRKLEFCGRLFTGAAAGISLYLACSALGRTDMPGCEAGSPCGKALQSPWAFVFGLPVSFPGFVLYSLALVLSGTFVRRERSAAGLQSMAVVASVVAGALWFSCLQFIVLDSLCLWCVFTQGFAAAGAVFLCVARMQHPAPAIDRAAGIKEPVRILKHNRLARFAAAGAAASCLGVLAAGAYSHAVTLPPLEDSTPVEELAAVPVVEPGGLAVLGGKRHVNPDDFPRLGREAPEERTVILLSDYTSALCRRYHSAVETSLPGAADPVRVIVLPAALTPEAMDIQRSVLTLHHSDHKAWRSLSALITSGQIPAEPEAVRRIARKLVGAEKWAAYAGAHADKIEQQLQLAASLLKESRPDGGSGAVPVLICGSRTLRPAGPDMDQFLAFVAGAPNTPAAPGKAAETTGTATLLLPERESPSLSKSNS